MKLIVTLKRKNDTIKGFLMGLIGFAITIAALLIMHYGFRLNLGALNVITVAVIVWSLWLVTVIFDFLTWRRAGNTRTVVKILLAWLIMFIILTLRYYKNNALSVAIDYALVIALVTAFMYFGVLVIGLLVRQSRWRIILKSLTGTGLWILGLYMLRWLKIRTGAVTVQEIVINAVVVLFLSFASSSAENPDDAISFWEGLGF